MKLEIRSSYEQLCLEVAGRIAALIREKPAAVLGLATGSTPVGIYAELIRLHQEAELSFAQVRCFNLDEYYPLTPEAPQSYARFMREKLFDHLDIPRQNCFIPSGLARSSEAIEADCAAYEAQIAAVGGLDFQLLGIGRNGHIGFNEPGSPRESRTRLVTLDTTTRSDAAGDFYGFENVPVRALTMGLATILEAREIALVASGGKKAVVVAKALEEKQTSKVPASFLRVHRRVQVWLDTEAASELLQFTQPWRLENVEWGDSDLALRTMVSVANRVSKPLAQVTCLDLAEQSAGRLAPTNADLERIQTQIKHELEGRCDDEAHLPRGKTVLCLSPHPDDDVICCGATLLKMAARGNRLFVAYGVSGANAIRDKDVLGHLRARHPRLISYLEEHLEPRKTLEGAINEVRSFIFERENGAPDAPLLRELKRLVREGEASDGCRKMGAKPLFLNLPFYGNGADRLPLGAEDVRRNQLMLETIRPDLVLLTGEKNDPHGTHEICEQAFNLAAQQLGADFERWNYRGAWDDYQTWEGDYFSVFGKELMDKKIDLILDHISQLDPLFPGNQPLEFWERARDRNRENARQLQRLGLLPESRSYDPLFVEVFKSRSSHGEPSLSNRVES